MTTRKEAVYWLVALPVGAAIAAAILLMSGSFGFLSRPYNHFACGATGMIAGLIGGSAGWAARSRVRRAS